MSTSTHAAESLYSQLINPSGSHIDLCVHASMDYNHYQSYPGSMIGSTFESVLPHLQTRFAVQASNPAIEAVIDEAPWPQSEVHLNYGYAVQIVDNAAQLTGALNYMPSAAFVRIDRALVLWGDNEGAIVLHWDEIISHIQSRYGTAVQSSAPSVGMSGGLDFDQWFNNLPPLDEFTSLATVPSPLPPSPGVASQAHAGAPLYLQWPAVQNESPDFGGLQLALHVPGASTPSSDASLSRFGDFPFTFTPLGSSLSPAHLVDGPSKGEDVASDVSVVSSSLSDRGVSPAPSAVTSEASTSTTIEQIFVPPAAATGTSSFRRHSVGQTDAPLGRTGSDRTVTKRGMSEDVNVDGDAFNNHNKHQNQHVPVMSDVRAFKRLRPFTVTPSSAPALLTVPLPTVDPASAHNDTTDSASLTGNHELNNNIFPTSRAPAPAPAAPAPSTPPAPAPAPAPRRGRRRAGGGSRVKRTQCEYCSKTFSRVQDAQRHVAASCAASPEKAGVECPECGSVLSRLDAAQRHWRGHENPTCETPEWALHA